MTLFSKDALARVLWTIVQVAAGVAAAKLGHIATWWAVAVAGGVVVIKTFAQTQAMRNPLGSLQLAVLERVGWTAAQAALGLVVVNNLNLSIAYVPVASAILAVVKAYVGKHVGSPDTAATLPASLDPGAPNPLLPAPAGLYDAPAQPVPLPPHPVQSSTPIPSSMTGYDPANDMPLAYPGTETPATPADPAPATPAPAPAPVEAPADPAPVEPPKVDPVPKAYE
jgi:hypothetical protein